MLEILYFILSSLILVASGFLLVKSLSKISRFLKISEFSAAFIIMALATSIPELFVGISSAIAGNPELSLGNVIGANIIDLTLITGILILMSKEIGTRSNKIGENTFFMLGSIALVIILYLINHSLSRIDGIILISLFSFSLYKKFKKRKKYTAALKNRIKRWSIVLNVFIFLLALTALFFSSKYVVKYATGIATLFNFPNIIVGLFLLSIATALPELVFGVSAVRAGHKEMAIGDQTGTIFTNSVLVLGIVAIISPIKAEFIPFLTSALFMFITAFIFVTFVATGKKLETLEGISLILIYTLFIIIEFFIRS